jgi:hypothetical protein
MNKQTSLCVDPLHVGDSVYIASKGSDKNPTDSNNLFSETLVVNDPHRYFLGKCRLVFKVAVRPDWISLRVVSLDRP